MKLNTNLGMGPLTFYAGRNQDPQGTTENHAGELLIWGGGQKVLVDLDVSVRGSGFPLLPFIAGPDKSGRWV